MKLSKIVLLLSLMLMPAMALADMTDQQIIQYVAEQSAKGTSQAEMLQYLLRNGVSPTRLQQLKDKYQKMQGKNGSSSTSSSSTDRSRSANTITNTNSVGMASMMGMDYMGTTNGRLVGSMPRGGRFSTTSQDYMMMQYALGGFFPDTAAMLSFMQPEEDLGPKVFGRDIFRNENISFEPNMNIATPANYVLGAGDLVFIDVYGASQLTIEGTISPDGFIVVEEYGPLQLAGLTVEEANRRAKSKLGSRFADSKIKLTVGQTRSIQINVMGEVRFPGSYTLPAFSTVFHALFSAGGVNKIGSLRNVKIYRNNQLLETVDIYDYILNGKMSGDLRLQDNDALVIAPYDILVNIAGKAKRPMYYEMIDSETIGKALEYAGGLASGAYSKSMRLIRKSGGMMQVLNVNPSNMESIKVADGDSLFIDSLLMRYENMVELKGAVFRPGMYQLDDQTKTIKSLLQYADGITESAYASHAVLQRMRKNRQYEVLQVDLEGILNGSAADIALQSEDVLFVPDTKDSQKSQTLTIRGEVYEPGIYQFAYNMTVEDLVLQAGGLKESASTKKVSVSRRLKSGGIETHTFDLNEGLSVNGKNRFVLEPFDEVMIKKTIGFVDQRSVTIEGEVNIQGEFSLPGENTRISEVLQMAGGLTERAAANGVFVYRPMNEEEIGMRNKIDKDLKDNFFRVAVDLPKVLSDPGCKEDLILRDGDRIIVQEHKNIVTIVGAVPYKSSVPYVEGKTQKYYLKQGGIRASRRNRNMSYVVGPNGQAHSYSRTRKIEPGSEICLRERTEELTTSQRVSLIASVVSAFATAAAVMVSVLK